MSFLAPLFLLGGLAVAVPVVLHLVRRSTRQRTVFSSLLFLTPTPPRLTRRSRLEHLLLLAVRCAILCLLAVGFARPFFKQDVAVPAAGGKRLLLLVDTSASMSRPGLWAAAQDQAATLLRGTTPSDQVAVLAFDRQVTPLVTFEQWNAMARGERIPVVSRRLADLHPSRFGTELGAALIRGAEMLAGAADGAEGGPGEMALISDVQEGCHLESLQGYEWPRNVQVTTYAVRAKHAGNAAIQWIADSDETDAGGPAGVRLRVSNYGGSSSERFKLAWGQSGGGTAPGTPLDVYVPPGQSRLVTLPLQATNGFADCARLEGDEAEFDNTVFIAPPETSHRIVVFSGTDSDSDPKRLLYFLRRAFHETRRQVVEVRARLPETVLSPSDAQAALWIVADPGPSERVRALREQAEAGRTLLYVLETERAGQGLCGLLGLERLEIQEARPDRYAMLAEIDFRHPLFAPFADPRFSDFTKIHFWKYRRVPASGIPNSKVVARFDSGDPALLEVPVGKGRVLILASSWRPDDSQLALSSKFVPLMYSLLETSVVADSGRSQYVVGERVRLDRLPGNASTEVVIRTPEGKEERVKAGDNASCETSMPGIYSVNSGPTQKRFVVNLDPAESRTSPLAADDLERLGVPMSRPPAAVLSPATRAAPLRNAEMEERQKLWRWFIVGALGLVVLETWLAAHTARRIVEPGALS